MAISTKLEDFILNTKPPPWSGRYKIPWDAPDFSRRMLTYHLSQKSDAASRRSNIIDQQVARLADYFRTFNAHTLLDLGCGPGLYSSRLARLGFACVGIDFSPASIAYAREKAQQHNLPCHYKLADLRRGQYGQDVDAIMFIFGEANAFPSSELRQILGFCYDALREGAPLVLEVHTFDYVEHIAQRPVRWEREAAGLFSDYPYVYLYESAWDETRQAASEYYFVISLDAEAPFKHYTNTLQAYTLAQYQAILTEAGFSQIQFLRALDGGDVTENGLFEVRAVKQSPS